MRKHNTTALLLIAIMIVVSVLAGCSAGQDTAQEEDIKITTVPGDHVACRSVL